MARQATPAVAKEIIQLALPCQTLLPTPAASKKRINSDPANIAPVRRAVEAFAAKCNFDEPSRHDIGLCVNEALANVIRHAYQNAADQPILITADFADPLMHITIRDWGKSIDASKLPAAPRDPLKPGGIGLICLRQLMDEIKFTPLDEGTLLTMTRNRATPGTKRAKHAPGV